MHVRLEELARGVDARAATAWWSDFREGPTDHAFFPGSRRAIVERGPSHVTMREHAVGVAWEVVTAWPGEREVRFAGRNRASSFRGVYAFEATEGGTRIVLDADIDLARPIRWSDRMARPVVVALLKADLRGHRKEMERDLRRGAAPSPDNAP